MTINIENSLSIINYWTNDSYKMITTHYYPHHSPRSIIFLHSSLITGHLLFFRLAYAGCYFFLVAFFLAKMVTFIRYFFFLLLSFRAPLPVACYKVF